MFKRPFKLFAPILAGATFSGRLISCLGALVGVGATSLICSLLLGNNSHLPFIVAPIGASAVLLFAVPSSPLARPWSIIGGNTLSALCGITVVRLVSDPMLAIGLAVGLAIFVMSVTRCLHPPGGAAALTAVIGGPAVLAAGFSFALIPVALNSVLLVTLGWIVHRFSGHSYPHVPAPVSINTHGTRDPAPILRTGFIAEDIDAALVDLGEAFDIDRDDLDRLLRRVEHRALARNYKSPTCADIMSRDVISVGPKDSTGVARRLLLAHNIRTLPVVDEAGRLLGTVGLRDLVSDIGPVGDAMAPALTAAPSESALNLVDTLTDGQSHAVVITEDNGLILGLLTQTDLLAAISRLPNSIRRQ